jgi:PKHD-type hydroxylase
MENHNFLKQNNNLTNYYYYEKSLSDEEINTIKELSQKYNTYIEGTVGDKLDLTYRKSKINWLPPNNETKFMYDKLVNLAKDANSKMWNFNITNLFDKLQFTEYSYNSEDKQQSHYDWHMDFGGTGLATTRKLSCSIQLTDPEEYEGCDLEFMVHRSIVKAPRKKGCIIFFPSYLTHRVTPITKGKRESLVIWFHGPTFT